jgi:hypothetical protein
MGVQRTKPASLMPRATDACSSKPANEGRRAPSGARTRFRSREQVVRGRRLAVSGRFEEPQLAAGRNSLFEF